MGVNLEAAPCPFCGSRLIHIGSWARSFDPPRLYHEWKHPPIVCYLNHHGGDVPLFCASDDVSEQIFRLERWNTRPALSNGNSESP